MSLRVHPTSHLDPQENPTDPYRRESPHFLQLPQDPRHHRTGNLGARNARQLNHPPLRRYSCSQTPQSCDDIVHAVHRLHRHASHGRLRRCGLVSRVCIARRPSRAVVAAFGRETSDRACLPARAGTTRCTSGGSWESSLSWTVSWKAVQTSRAVVADDIVPGLCRPDGVAPVLPYQDTFRLCTRE